MALLDPMSLFGTFPEAIPVDDYPLETPMYADGSWIPLPVLRFPEADSYQGTATKATMTFSIPLPDQLGVLERWWADRFRNGIIDEALRQGVTPLVVAAWRDSAPMFHTRYTLTIFAAGASPVPIPVIIALVVAGLALLTILVPVTLTKLENILIGRAGAPAELIPEGTPAPPGTVDAQGIPVPPGTPVKPGSYIPAKPGQTGLLGTVGDLAPLALLALLALLASMFKGK